MVQNQVFEASSDTPLIIDEPAVWECVNSLDQDEKWCVTAGIQGGFEYELFGNSDACGCSCCRRSVRILQAGSGGQGQLPTENAPSVPLADEQVIHQSGQLGRLAGLWGTVSQRLPHVDGLPTFAQASTVLAVGVVMAFIGLIGWRRRSPLASATMELAVPLASEEPLCPGPAE